MVQLKTTRGKSTISRVVIRQKGYLWTKQQMASLRLISLSSSCASWKSVGRKQVTRACANNNCQPKSFFLSPSDERILKKALKEPVAFMGGMFAGVLRLDLNEDPLKEWVTRTVEASGIITDEDKLDPQPQEVPQQIEIE